MSPKFGVRHDTKAKNTTKFYLQERWQGKEDQENLTHGQVNRAGKTQKLGKLCICIAFFYINFFAAEGHHKTSPSGEFAFIWQSKQVEIIAIEIERTRFHFLSDVFTLLANVGSVILPTELEVLTPVGEVARIFTEENSDRSRGRVRGVRTLPSRPDACLRLKFLHRQDRISLFN